MCPTSCDFDWQNLSISVPDATLYYVADIDPELEWEKIGLKRHNKDAEADEKLDVATDRAEQFFKTREGQGKLNEFLQSSISIFQDLATERDALAKHFPETEFIFVVGALRTGGTYLLNEFLRLLGLDRRDFQHRMVGDGVPFLKQSLFWNIPPNYLTWLFHVAQYLQWVKEKWPREDYVVKKRTCFGHCLPLVDEVFGESARYYLTLRHPGGIAGSSEDYFKTHTEGTTYADQGWDLLLENRYGESTEDWEDLAHEERVLKYWKTYYTDVGSTKRLRGSLTPVVFDRDSERVVREAAAELGVDHEPEPFTPSDRSFGGFWDSDQVGQAFEKVELSWQLYDREWPGMPRR